MTFSSEELQLLVDAIHILEPDDPENQVLRSKLYCKLLCRRESERLRAKLKDRAHEGRLAGKGNFGKPSD